MGQILRCANRRKTKSSYFLGAESSLFYEFSCSCFEIFIKERIIDDIFFDICPIWNKFSLFSKSYILFCLFDKLNIKLIHLLFL
jgi:hypothetical protein